jgi:hypothetical protein
MFSGLPSSADVGGRRWHFSCVPLAAIGQPYSITSSARASSVGGTVRPSALAVLRLIKSSMLVGNSTGRSPGLAPFQLKNAPLWALGFICPLVHVSALSDRLGSELGVGYLHHRQRPCARRRWLRDPSCSRLYKERSRRCPPYFHLSDNTPASARRHRDRCAKPSSRLEGNAQRQMPTLRRGARNLSARDIYQWRAETTDFAGSSRGPPLDCLTRSPRR